MEFLWAILRTVSTLISWAVDKVLVPFGVTFTATLAGAAASIAATWFFTRRRERQDYDASVRRAIAEVALAARAFSEDETQFVYAVLAGADQARWGAVPSGADMGLLESAAGAAAMIARGEDATVLDEVQLTLVLMRSTIPPDKATAAKMLAEALERWKRPGGTTAQALEEIGRAQKHASEMPSAVREGGTLMWPARTPSARSADSQKK